MIRTIWEVYNQNQVVQFIDEQEALAWKNTQADSFNIRSIEQPVDEPVPPSGLTLASWFNLEQALYQNPIILSKAASSTGNGFSFLLKVLTDGKTTGATETALGVALAMLIPSMTQPFDQSEIEYINQQLSDNGFQTRL